MEWTEFRCFEVVTLVNAGISEITKDILASCTPDYLVIVVHTGYMGSAWNLYKTKDI